MPISPHQQAVSSAASENPPISAEETFLAARSAHVSGDLAQAEQGYRRVLQADPVHADALHLLGVLQAQKKNPGEAERCIRLAIALKNDIWAFHDNLAKVLQEQGRRQEAREAYLRAAALKPDHADGLVAAAFISTELGDLQQAEAIFRVCAERWPDQPILQNNWGNTLYELGRMAEAEAAFRRAIQLAPDYAVAHYNLANLLGAQRRLDESIASYQDAVRARPAYPEALNNLGNLYLDLKQFQQAEAAYLKAHEWAPERIEIITNLGNLHSEQKRYQEAETWYRRSLAINPHLGHEQLLLSYCMRQMCAWDGLDLLNGSIRQRLAEQTEDVLETLQLFSEPGIDPGQQLHAGRLKILKDFAPILQQPPLVAPRTCRTRSRLRIGYLSADYHEHATMHLLLGVLEQRDAVHYETWLYSFGPDLEDNSRKRARLACEHFIDLRQLSDKAAAERIASDEIDILVDLKGYTTDSRLGISAWRPAPVIVSWLGYPGTLGHPRLADYIIGDPVVTPLEHASHFSETLALMPHCYQPTDAKRPIGRKPSRQEAGLPPSGFVFCSFNQAFKINPETFSLWCRLLDAIPDSILWLLEHTPVARANLRKEAAVRGIDPARLVFAKWASQPEHLGRIQLADLALDTFPYGSHTTGSDALWAGIPLVSLRGETFASRVSASLLCAVGLEDLVASDWDDYFSIARRLAANPAEYRAVKERLQANRLSKPLFDTAGFARDLERIYQAIWRQQQTGNRGPIALTQQTRSHP